MYKFSVVKHLSPRVRFYREDGRIKRFNSYEEARQAHPEGTIITERLACYIASDRGQKQENYYLTCTKRAGEPCGNCPKCHSEKQQQNRELIIREIKNEGEICEECGHFHRGEMPRNETDWKYCENCQALYR